jgi:hypothetical protein
MVGNSGGSPGVTRRIDPKVHAVLGEDVHERAMGMVRQNAWLLYEAGKAPNDPSQFGIEKPGAM